MLPPYLNFCPVQVYVSYDYGTTFTLVSEKFQLSEVKAKDGGTPVISQFYHSPADNRRVSTSSSLDANLSLATETSSANGDDEIKRSPTGRYNNGRTPSAGVNA